MFWGAAVFIRGFEDIYRNIEIRFWDIGHSQ